MKEPRDELKADSVERQDAPDFDALTPPEDVVRGGRTRDDFFDAILTLGSPTSVEGVAERAGHGVDAAREYLEWFERMGVVTRVTESPATYERNEAYLQWRRVQRLQTEYSQDELLEFLQAATERDEAYASEFDVDAPEDVSIAAYAREHDEPVEDVWEDVSRWMTTRRRITLLERALTGADDGLAGQQSPA
ncbi:hypothetical protein GCM10009037_19620 [Halarchaeum grantii]|uniref:Sugar-specific transcriptional regulator TrmB n=1 Tax=Halarchaeum grantii TaxID=1193105 RepID=A0A830FAX4_9EURY|nr:hypothetical protein [Halarchaeum grantii]GGL36157.1 hypothetical protein GCM10009037_19620 [Halarchaeum grantii]